MVETDIHVKNRKKGEPNMKNTNTKQQKTKTKNIISQLHIRPLFAKDCHMKNETLEEIHRRIECFGCFVVHK